MRTEIMYQGKGYDVSCDILGPMQSCYYSGMSTHPENIGVDGSGSTVHEAIECALDQVPDTVLFDSPTEGDWEEDELDNILNDPTFLDRVEEKIIDSLTNHGIDVDQSSLDEEDELEEEEYFDSYFFAQITIRK